MQQNDLQQGNMRRNLNDLIMAEMFLVQATIESATAIGDGIGELRRHISGAEDSDGDSLQEKLQRIADQALEPYTTRLRYLRKLREDKE